MKMLVIKYHTYTLKLKLVRKFCNLNSIKQAFLPIWEACTNTRLYSNYQTYLLILIDDDVLTMI